MVEKLDNAFVKMNKLAIGIMMVLMFSLVIVNVITRYIFGFSINWVEEISKFLMIWITFIGAGLAMRGSKHVAIEILQDYIPQKMVPIIRIINAILIIIFMGILAYLGYQYALGSMNKLTSVLRWPIGYVYLVIPISAVLFIFHMLLDFRRYVKREESDLFDDLLGDEGEI